MAEFRWMKIDTASIMFSSLSSKSWGRTFRVAVVLRDEEVRPDILKKAAADLAVSFPSMYSFIRKGFFWNYQEGATLLPEIREEHSRQLLPITMRNDGRPDFRILYHKRRIALETAHYLGDGTGVGIYFDALMERYVELCENPESEYKPVEVKSEYLANSYADYFQKDGEKEEQDNIDAYHLEGEIKEGYLQLIFTMIPMEEIKVKAKEMELTVTEYLATALILGAIRNASAPIEKPVVIATPVNLRKFFPSATVRNFTVQSKIVFCPEGRTDWTFEEIADSIRGQLKSRTTKENLQKTLNRFGSLAGNPIIKPVPNFIKQAVIRKSQKDTHAGFTTILTNTGESDFSDRVKERIERVDGVNGDTSGYGLLSTCSALSNNGLFSMCFSLCSEDTSWVKTCVRILSERGLNIRVESTDGNGEYDL